MSDALLPRRVSRLVEILQLLIPHVLGSNPTHNFVLYLPVSILRVIINVRCAFTKKSKSSSGNTSTSYSTCPGFKSHSQLCFISACVHSKGYN